MAKKPLWIKPREAADLLGVSLKTIYQMRDAGELGFLALGDETAKVRPRENISFASVERVMAARYVGPREDLEATLEKMHTAAGVQG